jgi:hypothetical protein
VSLSSAVCRSIINDSGNFEVNDYVASDYHTGASVNRSFYVDDGTNAGYAYHGSALLDSGASINLFGVHANASLINPRRSPARVAGYSATARRHADKFGRVFMCVTDGAKLTPPEACSDEGVRICAVSKMFQSYFSVNSEGVRIRVNF